MIFSGGGKPLTKPPAGCQINWQNPITDKLRRLWVLNEGSGTPFDLVRFSPMTTIAEHAWGGGKAGTGLSLNGSTQGYRATNHAGMLTVHGNYPKSVMCFCQPASTASGQTVFGKWHVNRSPSGRDFRLSTYNSTKWTFGWSDGFNEERLESSYVFSAEELCVITASHKGVTNGAGTIFVNGVRNSGVNYVTSSGGYDADMTIGCGINTDVGPVFENYFSGKVYLAAYWERALSDFEHIALQRNPYQLIKGPAKRIFVPSGGGGSFQSAWARNSNTLIYQGVNA
jgi:hypothetical protein